MAVPQYGTKEHDLLKDLVIRRLDQSERQMQTRHKRWRESERSYRLFVDPDQIQEPVEPIAEHQELLYPYPTSVVVPLSYAIAQTLISFWTTLFSNSMPYLRIGNRNPDSSGAAKAQELLLSYQLDYIGYLPLLYQWLLDSLRYGLGIVRISWQVKEVLQTFRSMMQLPILGQTMEIPFSEKRSVLEYEGNHLEVIDPFTFRPDPRHPIACFQDGSFCGEAMWRSYFDLLKRQDEGLYEQVEQIPQKTIEGMGRRGGMNQSDRNRIISANQFFGEKTDATDAGMVLVESVGVDLIPRDVGIGESTKVERYLVTLANRTVLIRSEPFPYDHQEYTYAIMESSPDKHSLLNPGVMELMEPLSQHITWLYNSHVENVRKTLNDVLIVDPDRINMEDLLNPSAGKIIRIREQYYGSGVEGAVAQLPITDITSGNIQTAGVLQDLLQRLSAASDAVQGETERVKKTATEVSLTAQMSGGRLRTMARVLAAQGIKPMAKQMVQNNMSFLSQSQYLRLAGSLERDYQAIGKAVSGGVEISPEDVQGLFDFPIMDASMPLDPTRYAEVWMQIAQQAVANPAVAPRLDHLELFKQQVHSMGITDLSRFIVPEQVQVMPDQQVEQQVQAGNLTPMPGMTNGSAQGMR